MPTPIEEWDKNNIFLFHDKFGNNIKMVKQTKEFLKNVVKETEVYEFKNAKDENLTKKEKKEFLKRLIATNKLEFDCLQHFQKQLKDRKKK